MYLFFIIDLYYEYIPNVCLFSKYFFINVQKRVELSLILSISEVRTLK